VVIAAIQAQLQKQALHSQEFLDPLRAQAARLLASITPGAGALSHSFFVNSGAEAVEAAIKLSMAHTGRGRLLSCLNGFHGKTLGALAATSKALFRAPFTRALMDVVHVPFNDVPALTAAFAAANFTGNKFCALLIEPIQGEGGIHVAKTEFLKAARELCTREGTCLVLDEVQTGMGRTSAMFACEHFDVVPDLLCVGKSLSGGVFPVAACCGGEHVWAKYVESPFLFTTTFGGSPLACAAAISTIHVLLKDRLVDAARERGQQLSRGLQGLMQDFPDVIKDVRGLGLMLGVELQSNDIGIAWSSALLRNNVLVSGTLIHATTVRVCPPLTITPEEVCIALEAMRCACESVRRAIIFGRSPVAKL
jgi:putrescine aminotransferase